LALTDSIVIAAELGAPVELIELNDLILAGSTAVLLFILNDVLERDVARATAAVVIVPKLRSAAVNVYVPVIATGRARQRRHIVGPVVFTVPSASTALPIGIPRKSSTRGAGVKRHLAIVRIAARRVAVEALIVLELTRHWNELRAVASIVALHCETIRVQVLNRIAHLSEARENVFIAVLVQAVGIVGAHVLEVHCNSVGGTVDGAEHRLIETQAFLPLLADRRVEAITLGESGEGIKLGDTAFNVATRTYAKVEIDSVAIARHIAITKWIGSPVHGPRLLRELTVVRVEAGREVVRVRSFGVEAAEVLSSKRRLL